ncbi:hypothetical protein M8J76_013070 [Diaphorina citri]|nr:hypothetical protein M8J76_013070 [Diaphorina citri]
MLNELGYSNVWEAQDPSLLKQNFEVILDKYSTELIKQDWDRLTVSTYYELYKELKPRVEITSSKENFTSSYLLMRVPIDRIRIAAQLRLCGRYVKFYIGNMSHTWDSEEVCSICNQQRKESVQHFLMECPQYCPIRKRFLDSILSRPGNNCGVQKLSALFCGIIGETGIGGVIFPDKHVTVELLCGELAELSRTIDDTGIGGVIFPDKHVTVQLLCGELAELSRTIDDTGIGGVIFPDKHVTVELLCGELAELSRTIDDTGNGGVIFPDKHVTVELLPQ